MYACSVGAEDRASIPPGSLLDTDTQYWYPERATPPPSSQGYPGLPYNSTSNLPGKWGQVNTEMTDQPPLLHKTWMIELRSYRRNIGWIPKVTVKRSVHTIAGTLRLSCPLKRLRIRWLKSWPLNGLIPSSLHRQVDV